MKRNIFHQVQIEEPEHPPEENSFSIEQAREDATNSAFKFVRNKLTNTSDLESLELIKQTADIKHMDKIAFLKARVQGYVRNIEMGLADMEKANSVLRRLLSDIGEIETQSHEVSEFDLTKQISNFKSLGVIWENLNQIKDLNSRFGEAETYIDAVEKFFILNPNGFSIKCFKTIDSLLKFEQDVLEKMEAKENEIRTFNAESPNKDKAERAKVYLIEKFKPIHEAKEKLMNNVHDLFLNIFTGFSNIETDLIVRAAWIFIANGQKNRILDNLEEAMRNQFLIIDQNPTEDKLNIYLQQLNDIIDKLPEQIEHIVPALPGDINVFGFIVDTVNDQIVDVLENFVRVFKPSSFLSITLIKAMKDIECTLKALLGINVGERFTQLIMKLQEGFESIVLNDYSNFLTRIISMYLDSVSQRRNGILYTPAPLDFMRRLEDGYNFVKSSGLNILPSIRSQFVQILTNKLYELHDSLDGVVDHNYLIAVCNNSYDGKNAIMQMSKDSPEILTQSDTKQLMQAWVSILKKSLSALFELLYFSIIGEDNQFKVDFNEKIEKINQFLEDASNHLLEPLFVKFFSSFCKNIIPHYMCSYYTKPDDIKETSQFQDKIKGECSAFIELFNSYTFEFSKRNIKIIEAFQDFMTSPFEDSMHIIYVLLAKEYTDFTPKIAGILLKVRPDSSKQSLSVDDCVKSFETVYVNIEQRPEDHIFADSKKPEKKFLK